MQHLHHQMGLAEGRAARNRGPDRRGNRRVQEIDIQTDMQQAVFRSHAVQKGFQRGTDAFLVNPAHVADANAVTDKQASLRIVDGADTQNFDVLRFHRVLQRRAEQIVKPGKAAQKRKRGAVQIAAGGAFQRVKIRMGIEPEHKKGSAERGSRLRLARDRAGRHGMIAAEINRHDRAFAKIRRLLVQGTGPADIGRVVAQNSVGRRESADIRRRQVAVIRHRMAKLAQCILQACGSVGIRPHETAPLTGPFVHRRSDQDYLFFNGVHVPLAPNFDCQKCVETPRRSKSGHLIKRAAKFIILEISIYRNGMMDDLDLRLITLLRHDGRRSVSELAGDLKVARATVRSRMEKLVETGEILGFTAVLRDDWRDLPIRAVTLVVVDGHNTEPVIRSLSAMTEVRAIHSTNGKWDLVLDVATRDLVAFDDALNRIRLIEGITGTETSLLLTTRKGPAVSASEFKDVLG